MKLLDGLRTKLHERQTIRAHVWQTLANYAQQMFGLVFGVIMARILFPSDFGAFGFAAASVFLVLLPATWSLAPTLVADAGRTHSLHTTAAGFGWCVVFARLAIVIALVTWFYFRSQPQTALLCLICGFVESCRELNSVQRAYLEGQGNFKPNFISSLLGILFCLGAVVPVAFFVGGPVALALPGLGVACMDFFLYRHFSGRSVFVKPAWNLDRETFRNGFWIWLIGVSEVGLARLDSWFIGRFRGYSELGDYNRAFGYAPLSHMLLNSLLANPTAVGLARCETASARRRLLGRTSMIVFAGGLVNWFLFFFFARPIVLFVFGSKWEGVIPVFQAFASLSLAYAFGLLPVTLLLAARRYRELALVRITTVTIFACALFLVPGSWSATSVAWLVQATLLTQGLILIVFCRPLLVGK